jgi:hypothetical protein
MNEGVFKSLRGRMHSEALPAAFPPYVLLILQVLISSNFFLFELCEIPIHLPVRVFISPHIQQ